MLYSARTLDQLKKVTDGVVKKAREFEKSCEVCEVKMMTAYTTTRYCSEACRKAAYKKRVWATEEPTAMIICGQCGESFPWYRKIDSKRKKFCSQQCAAQSGAHKGDKAYNGHSLLTQKPCRVNRSAHCHRKISPFEVAQCKHYHNWGTSETQFHCDCKEGFTL